MRKIGIIVICLLMGISFLTGCSTTSSTTSGDQSLENIKKAGKFRVGLDDQFPPMGFHDPKTDEIVGFDIDMAKELGKKLGVDVEFIPTDWNGVFVALNSGKFDTIINGLSITEDRKEKIDFSKPYMYNNQVIIVKDDNSAIKGKDDLNGKIVGVQSGSTSENAISKVSGIKEVKKYKDNPLAFGDLKAGRIDAVVADEIVARHYISEQKTSGLAVLKDSLEKEPYGIGYRKGDKAFQDAMNKALDELFKDGTMTKLSQKWFGEDITAKE